MIQFYSLTSINNDAYELSRWYPGDHNHKNISLEWFSADVNFIKRLVCLRQNGIWILWKNPLGSTEWQTADQKD